MLVFFVLLAGLLFSGKLPWSIAVVSNSSVNPKLEIQNEQLQLSTDSPSTVTRDVSTQASQLEKVDGLQVNSPVQVFGKDLDHDHDEGEIRHRESHPKEPPKNYRSHHPPGWREDSRDRRHKLPMLWRNPLLAPHLLVVYFLFAIGIIACVVCSYRRIKLKTVILIVCLFFVLFALSQGIFFFHEEFKG